MQKFLHIIFPIAENINAKKVMRQNLYIITYLLVLAHYSPVPENIILQIAIWQYSYNIIYCL